MALINTYTTKTTPVRADFVIGSDSENTNETANFYLGDIAEVNMSDRSVDIDIYDQITLDMNYAKEGRFHTNLIDGDINLYWQNNTNALTAIWIFYITGTRVITFDSNVAFPDGTTGWTPAAGTLSIAGSTGIYCMIKFNMSTVNSNSRIFAELLYNFTT